MTSHRQSRMEKKSMGKNMFRVVMCTSLVLAAMYSLRAQTVNGTILGLIQDQQGGPGYGRSAPGGCVQLHAGRLREFDHHPRAPVERPRLAPTGVVAAGSPAKCGRISG